MQLKVLTYNIHKCIGGVDRRYEPARIVEVIRKLDADVVMLQCTPDGKLTWDAPAGSWLLLRMGHTTTGAMNAPAPEAGHPLRCRGETQ